MDHRSLLIKITAGVLAMVLVPCMAWGSEPEPTLDELLGLPESKPSDPTGGAGADGRIDPDKIVGDGAPGPLFDQAIGEMRDATARLGRSHDAGVRTQRLHQSIIAKLDQLIEFAKKQDSSGGSGGGGGASGQPRRTSRSSMGQAQGGAAAAGAGSNPSQGAAGSGAPGAAVQSGQTPGLLEENRTGWGQLPPRVRDELQQGIEEPFSPVYQRLTEQYYKRLAEEGRERE